MLVGLRTVELLALFSVVGVPINLALFRSPAYGRPFVCVLLAPVTGFAALAVLAAWFMASGRPLRDVAPIVWVVVAVAWLAVVVAVAWRRPWQHAQFGRGVWLRFTLVLLGLVIVLGVYLRPFIQEPELIFWHYAGSDGYAYMQVADYLGAVGLRPIPDIGLRDGALGFTAMVVSQLLRPDGVGDKPGTFAILAALSAVHGVLPHELFSPLTLAAIGLLYLALIGFGTALGLSTWSVVALAVLGCSSPAVLMLSMNTFLANTLSLHIFPLLLTLWRTPPTWRMAAFSGVLGGVQTWLFPDATPIVLGMAALLVGFLLLRTPPARWPRAIAWPLGIALVTAVLIVLPFGAQLAATGFRRFGSILNPSPSPGASGWHPLPSIDWLWPAFNLNVLPPVALKSSELPFVVLFGAAGLVFIGVSWTGRRALDLLVGLGGLALVLVAGAAGGLFAGDYELFRALAVYAFCPLAALFVVLEWAARLLRRPGMTRLPSGAVVAGVVLLLGHFVLNDRFQFGQAYAEHLADAQYTRANLQDRFAIAELGSASSLVLGNDTPSFTALSNVLVLLSPARPAVPNAFYPFLFFGSLPPQDVQYGSDLVLVNRRYRDIFSVDRGVVYRSEDFLVVHNDLIPFFDSDTFPMLNPLPRAFVEARGLAVGRLLFRPTEVIFVSRTARHVRLSLDFADEPRTVAVALDGSAERAAEPNAAGNLTLSGWRVEPGLHRLRLSLVGSEPARLHSLSLDAVE